MSASLEPNATHPDNSSVCFERILPGPIERVWEYLTAPGKRALWLADGSTDSHIGGQVKLFFTNDELSIGSSGEEEVTELSAKYNGTPDIIGTITRCEPPHLFAHTWPEDESGEHISEVTFEVAPVSDQQRDAVKIIVTHRRVHDRTELLGLTAGWHAHLAILGALLTSQAPPAFWTTFAALEKEYGQRAPFAGVEV